MAVLSWIGRQGTRAVAALIVIGIVMPSIGALLKFVLLCIAFLRVDAAAFRIYLGRPTIVLAATAWTSLVIPTLFGASYLAFGLKDQSPDRFLALVLQAIASPLMAAPALAALIGLDATPVLCTMVTSTALLPFTAPLFAYAFIGPALTLSPLARGLKLFAILAGSALVGFTVRQIAGLTAIERPKERINGFNRQRQKAVELYTRGKLDEDELDGVLRRLRQRRAAVEAQLKALHAPLEVSFWCRRRRASSKACCLTIASDSSARSRKPGRLFSGRSPPGRHARRSRFTASWAAVRASLPWIWSRSSSHMDPAPGAN